jgi:glycosyltransferase involved in cell wall biosynthesis
MRKLLFVWQNLDYGGGEIALINLLEQLKAHYKITLLCYENINKLNPPVGIDIIFASNHSTNKLGKIWNKILFFGKWIIIARKFDLQIINEVPFMVIMAWFISLFTQKIYVLWAHSCRSEMRADCNWLTEQIYRHSLINAKQIVCVSERAANSMCDYVRNKLPNTVIINNILQFKPLINLPKLPDGFIKICAVGRLTHEKNFLLLVEAFAVAKANTNYPLILYICGDGKEQNLLINRISDLKLNDSVILTGHVDNALSYINQCDIFVSSSNSESWSIVVCEALYCSKAIIATNTGAAEILENGRYGVVVEIGNKELLSQALILLINDNNLRERYSNNSKYALNKFDQNIILQQWHDLIEYNLA